MGLFIPNCDEHCNYEAKQCHGSTGHCWCVDQQTGAELFGTRRGPTQGSRDLNCNESPPEEPLKKEGEDCGSCYCPPTYTAGECEPGLECVSDPLIPDAPGICQLPDLESSDEGSCKFSHDCRTNGGSCESIQDASCVCNYGRCLVRGFDPSLWVPGASVRKRECSEYTDCPCSGDRDRCFCIDGECVTEEWECHGDLDCQDQAKCAGKQCTCQGGTCEWQCSSEADCIQNNNAFYCEHEDYQCSCERGQCESVPRNPPLECVESSGTVRQDGEEWECEDGCNTCSCHGGQFVSTLVYCGTDDALHSPHQAMCGNNEEFAPCGESPCYETCEHKNGPPGCIPTERCFTDGGCQCQRGYVRTQTGECVLPEQCPAMCGDNEEFAPCGESPCYETC